MQGNNLASWESASVIFFSFSALFFLQRSSETGAPVALVRYKELKHNNTELLFQESQTGGCEIHPLSWAEASKPTETSVQSTYWFPELLAEQ